MACARLVRGLYEACTRLVRDLYETCLLRPPKEHLGDLATLEDRRDEVEGDGARHQQSVRERELVADPEEAREEVPCSSVRLALGGDALGGDASVLGSTAEGGARKVDALERPALHREGAQRCGPAHTELARLQLGAWVQRRHEELSVARADTCEECGEDGESEERADGEEEGGRHHVRLARRRDRRARHQRPVHVECTEQRQSERTDGDGEEHERRRGTFGLVSLAPTARRLRAGRRLRRRSRRRLRQPRRAR